MEWQKKAFLLFVGIVSYFLIPLYIQQFGALEDVYNHEPGPCKYIEGLDSGSEDLQTLPNGLTFISSGVEKQYNRSKVIHGGIFLFDFNNPKSPAIPLNLEGNFDLKDFTPHGISVYRNEKTGKVILFVVNHDPDGDIVEKFQFFNENKTLVHLKSFVDNRLTTANDVAAVSEDSFYYTNYLYSVNHVFKSMEIYMPMTWGSIFFWKEGERPQLVVNKLKQPNGIVSSKDNRFYYVAHEGEQELHVYERSLANNSLTLRNVFNVNTSVDNLHLSPDGRFLWLGCHAVFWKMYKQMSDPNFPAPSQVLRLEIQDGIHVSRVTEVYANDGSILKGSSVASYYKGRLLIGTVMHKTLLCDMKAMDQ